MLSDTKCKIVANACKVGLVYFVGNRVRFSYAIIMLIFNRVAKMESKLIEDDSTLLVS